MDIPHGFNLTVRQIHLIQAVKRTEAGKRIYRNKCCSPEQKWFVTGDSPRFNIFCFTPLGFVGWCVGAGVDVNDLSAGCRPTVASITVPVVVVSTGIISIFASERNLGTKIII